MKEKYIIMLDTLQGKHGLLVEEELYIEQDVIEEGFALEWLFENSKARWFDEKKDVQSTERMIKRLNKYKWRILLKTILTKERKYEQENCV